MKIPFDDDGNSQFRKNDDSNMIDNYQFNDGLLFQKIEKKYSSICYIFKSTTKDVEYHMLSKDFQQMINRSVITLGLVYGDWTFVKRGKSYGIVLV